jgi:hypothetical protein
MDVYDIVPAAAQNVTQLSPQSEANGDAGLRSIAVDRLTAPETDDVRLLLGTRNVRGDDVDVMSAPASFARKEMDVLANAAEVRVVVLRDESDPERAVIPNYRQMRQLGKAGVSTGAGVLEG